MIKSLAFLPLSALLLAAAAPMPAARGNVQGMWINPYASVAVRTGPCRDGKLCGWIVWANDEAKADARDGGIQQLIGTELLEDYRAEGSGRWAGTVFVPDMGRHFSSTIVAKSPQSLKISGCLLGGFLCRSQVWQRIEKLPNA